MALVQLTWDWNSKTKYKRRALLEKEPSTLRFIQIWTGSLLSSLNANNPIAKNVNCVGLAYKFNILKGVKLYSRSS